MKELTLDLSKYDKGIDLAEWKKKRNLFGVIIKVGGNEGGRYKDKLFETHYANAKAAGLHIGFYYYTTTTDVATANVDANHMIELVGDKFYDLPWYMDVEDPGQFKLTARKLTDVIKSFCNTLSNKGIYSGLYTGGYAWLNNMYSNELMDYANWIAWWRSSWPHEAGDIGMWQQGGIRLSDGNIVFDDIPGYHDCDWCVVDYPSRIKNGDTKQTDDKTTVIPKQNAGVSLNDFGFSYRAHCQTAGWFPAVRDGQVAGSVGYSARIEALKFSPSKEMGTLTADVHIQGIGWKTYSGIKAGERSGEKSSIIDPICGTTGQGRRLEAFKLKLSKNTTGKKLRYMGHVEGIGWMDPVWEGEVCGTTGKGKRLEAVRIWLDDPDKPLVLKSSDINQNGSNIVAGRASDVINTAYSELGYYAPNDPERGSKYGRWMAKVTGEDWMAGPSSEIWWCCMFVSWCLAKGGVKMDGFPSQNTDLALRNGAKKYAISDKKKVQYGDIVIFNWDWNNTTDHIGFATGTFDGAGFTTIEGNVGNAVVEKYRQLGNVAYILRPPYTGYGVINGITPTVETYPKNNRDGGQLDVDGIGGWNTIIDWQHQLGVIEDGYITGQDVENKDSYCAMSNVQYGTEGSKLVMAIQAKVGVEVDGQWGFSTSKGIQNWLISNGYDCGKSGADGIFGSESVKALQKSLNDGKWKM